MNDKESIIMALIMVLAFILGHELNAYTTRDYSCNILLSEIDSLISFNDSNLTNTAQYVINTGGLDDKDNIFTSLNTS